MQPLGYYGLKLQTESYYDGLTVDQLVALMSISADEIYDLYHDARDLSVPTAILNEGQILSVPQKLALIRATCDRIELKLMEEAK